MVDFTIQRLNMVESQVRPSDVTDRRVTMAMSHVERQRFVTEGLRPVAYADRHLEVTLPSSTSLPSAGDETTTSNVHPTSSRWLIEPRVFAKLVQHLELGDHDVVLDIACATGYSTAVLAHIAQTVVGIEAEETFVTFATEALSSAGIDNAVVVHKPLMEGYPEEGPYDAILINGLVAQVPEGILDQLKDGGRLVTIEENGRYGAAVQWRRVDGSFDKRWLFDCTAPRLMAFDLKPEFVF